MSSTPSNDVSLLLQAAKVGDRAALDRLFEVVQNDLRAIAGAAMRKEAPGQTLQTTGLINEAYIRLAGQRGGGYQDRAQFFGVAAQVMRRILVDRARARKAAKRGGPAPARTPLDDIADRLETSAMDIEALDAALDRLGAIDPQKRRLVELRFFAGLEMREAAELMGLPLRTAEREWTTARAWLRSQITPAE